MLVLHDECNRYINELRKERDNALEECKEQARLLGMSGSREASLITERESALKNVARLAEENCRLKLQLEKAKEFCFELATRSREGGEMRLKADLYEALGKAQEERDAAVKERDDAIKDRDAWERLEKEMVISARFFMGSVEKLEQQLERAKEFVKKDYVSTGEEDVFNDSWNREVIKGEK